MEMTAFKKDTTMLVEIYNIEDYKTAPNPYEGHYPHYETKITSTKDSIKFRKGDFYIKSFQPSVRYLLETLEPTTPDSFFNWNFFDTMLQQKEGFSPYVFEDLAKEILDKDPALNEEFQEKKKSETEFSQDWFTQLNWVYKKSGLQESAYLRYPVFRVSR